MAPRYIGIDGAGNVYCIEFLSFRQVFRDHPLRYISQSRMNLVRGDPSVKCLSYVVISPLYRLFSYLNFSIFDFIEVLHRSH